MVFKIRVTRENINEEQEMVKEIVPDYGISAVGQSDSGGKISRFRVHLLGEYVDGMDPIEFGRERIFEQIEEGKLFVTLVENDEGNLIEGAEVNIIGNEYLRTGANDIKEDNLGELPTFVPKIAV